MSEIEELPDLRPVSPGDVVSADVSTALERFECRAPVYVSHHSARKSRLCLFSDQELFSAQALMFVPIKQAELQMTLKNVHTPTMTLKNASLLALVGTILVTALLVWTFVFTLLNVLRSLVPAEMLFSSFIYAFGSFSMAVFFYVFHRAQS